MNVSELDPAARYIYETLVNANICSDRVCQGAIDEGVQYPAIRFLLVSGSRTLAGGAEVLTGDPLYLVTAHGRPDAKEDGDRLTSLGAAALAGLIDQALPTNVAALVNGCNVYCWTSDRGTYQDAEFEDGARYDCAGAYYQFMIEEA